jgi:hypothetical protein
MHHMHYHVNHNATTWLLDPWPFNPFSVTEFDTLDAEEVPDYLDPLSPTEEFPNCPHHN